MPLLTLDGDTLGEKHKHHNKLVQDAIANKNYELRNVSYDDSDIDNLLKIDIASKTRNVDYIIQVMKSNDMLYAATAIKKSRWLITEPQYANIINPEYLHTQLLPSMNTKTLNKLMLHIRLNLKDEKRVETFYEYLKETDGAYKWLQNCSIPFIENVIKNERLIPLSLFKRLCRRSAHFIAYYSRVVEGIQAAKKQLLFLLKSHTKEVLNIFDNEDRNYFPELGRKKTEVIMKFCPQMILEEFEKYYFLLDLSVFTKYVNKKEVKAFLCKHIKINSFSFSFYDQLVHFVKHIPENERFEFVKKTFIDKTDIDLFSDEYAKNRIISDTKAYKWYEHTPFTAAFPALKYLIRTETSPSERCAMLTVLITCARKNSNHVKNLLNYYYEKHINELLIFKIRFVNNFLSQISSYEFDIETWNVLNQLFHSMEVYTESDNNVHDIQVCLQSIILYKVLHDEPVPDIVERKVSFCTFKTYQRGLSQQQRCKLFTYLLNTILSKLQNKNIANKINFKETIEQLCNALTFFKDWRKEIYDYPFIIEKIKELIEIKKENKWEADLRALYHMKKSWRKHMFEESLSLCLSEETCLNALKHNPQLLTRHDKEIETLRTNDAVTLRRLLTKLRVYWPHSLAQQWTNAYLQNLNKPTGQKAVVKNLFMLLPQNEIIELAKIHTPSDLKINWAADEETEIIIRKNIAKHLHLARPLIPLDTILWYAKGDYLQHAIPSLNAALSNLSEVESRDHLPKLLDEPVSLQQFGLHLAFSKLKSEDLKSIFWKMWNTTRNLTIRYLLFKCTHTKICKAKNEIVEKELWELLSMFIDDLSSEKNTDLYETLVNVNNVPISIRAEYYMKSFNFFAKTNCVNYLQRLILYVQFIMEFLPEDFAADEILIPLGSPFCSDRNDCIEVFACYTVCCTSEEDQLYRFRRFIEPAMEEAFYLWDCLHEGKYYVQNNFNHFIKSLVWHFRLYYIFSNNIPLPVQLFVEIKTKMESELPLLENYVLYTSWKLITKYVKLLKEHSSMLTIDSSKFSECAIGYGYFSGEMASAWKDIHIKISPLLGPVIVQCLKEDIKYYNFPTIYCLFTEAVERMFEELGFLDEICLLETLKHMLNDSDFDDSYLVVSKVTPKCFLLKDAEAIRCDICKKIESHPSQAVRAHYYNDFQNLRIFF